VLVMTDEPTLAEAITLTLNHGAFLPQVASGAEQAAAAIEQSRPHIVVLDTDVDGGSLLDRLRSMDSPEERIPTVVLTRRSGLRTRLEAFERGADDVLTLPFAPEELLARVMAILRRTYHTSPALKPVMTIADLEIDIVSRRVRVGEHELHLTSVELAMLYLLAANPGVTLSRDQILDRLWGNEYMAESNLIDRHIRNLRVKLQNSARQPRYIFTVPGQGYRFLNPESSATA
jgi:DNA-binding response OmpR family regulator